MKDFIYGCIMASFLLIHLNTIAQRNYYDRELDYMVESYNNKEEISQCYLKHQDIDFTKAYDFCEPKRVPETFSELLIKKIFN